MSKISICLQNVIIIKYARRKTIQKNKNFLEISVFNYINCSDSSRVVSIVYYVFSKNSINIAEKLYTKDRE
jgi:hypothetical protein